MTARLTAARLAEIRALVAFDVRVGNASHDPERRRLDEGNTLNERAWALFDLLNAHDAASAPASRDAGEALYAALEELGVADDLDSASVERAAVHVERYGERREEAGAEAADEQRAIERRGGVER